MTTSRIIAAAVAVMQVAACGSDDGSSDEGVAKTTSSDTTTPATTASEVESKTIAIGDGQVLYVQCRGEGSPTIVLEAGDESGHEDCQAVVVDLGARHGRAPTTAGHG